jgi:hypothetical protein
MHLGVTFFEYNVHGPTNKTKHAYSVFERNIDIE